MRDKNLRRVVSIITFTYPLNINYIYSSFDFYQEKSLQLYPTCSFKATKRIIIGNYWFRQVLSHFSVVLGIALLVTIPLYKDYSNFLSSILIGGLPSFITVTLFIYFPSFYSDFLPKLDTIVGEREKLSIQAEETKKCKRTQFQIPTLIVIYYTLSKMGDLPSLPANDSSAELLNKLFGTDKDKLKQNLARLYKLSSLSARERAEMLKGVENAREYFEQIGCTAASNTLQELELKLHCTNKA